MFKPAMRGMMRVGMAIGIMAASFLLRPEEARADDVVESIRIRALIDGKSRLILRTGTAQWYHIWGAAPGRHEFANEPTVINGVEWFPVWSDIPDQENRDCYCYSDIFTGVNPPLPDTDGTIGIQLIHDPGGVARIVQYPTALNDHTMIVEFDDTWPVGSAIYIVNIVFTRQSTPPIAFLSTDGPGQVDDVAFDDEDILAYRSNAETWFKLFDGSDVGLSGNGVDAFSLMEDGSVLLSLSKAQELDGTSLVKPADIVRFVPTTLGEATSGTFELFLKGADVGLSTNAEDIDAMGWRPDHRLVVSTRGPFTVPGWRNTTISGRDEDLIVLINQAFGESSEGYWQLYFDGSDVELGAATEDVRGIWIEPVTDRLYLATEGAFSVTDASGDASDILACDLISAGRNTRCSFSVFWRGQEHGLLNQHVDGIQFGFEPRVPIEPAPDPNAGE